MVRAPPLGARPTVAGLVQGRERFVHTRTPPPTAERDARHSERAWDSYRVETVRFDDAGDQVAVVVHITGRTHDLDIDETRSSLLTVRDGRVVRVESFADPDGARRAVGRPS
jgi:ketosteroid isomerase-like protein